MKKRLVFILKYYLFILSVFVLQKPIFMLYNQGLSVTVKDVFAVVVNGFSMDLSTAAYFTIIPLFILWSGLWIHNDWPRKVLMGYTLVVLLFFMLIIIPDFHLFSSWGTHLDSSVFFYLKSPAGAAASVPYWMIALFILTIILSVFIFYSLFKKTVGKHAIQSISRTGKTKQTVLLIPILLLLFLAIRGGVGASTMNVGHVFFSGKMFLNQSAINPVFNFLYSVSHANEEEIEYNFMKDEEAERRFTLLRTENRDEKFPALLSNQRPDVVFIVLESFSAKVIGALGGIPDVTPNFNRLSGEGVLFTNFYANSFRTDRGLISLLSGTPSLPTVPLMRYAGKLTRLPSISLSLKKQGYDLSLLYGGDVNFANMRQYFVCSGFEKIASDVSFPLSDRRSRWGVPDEITFNHLYKEIENEKKRPFLKFFLTLSSHEPFDVPTRKFKEPFLNSVHYTDSCLGNFIEKLKLLPNWKNTLVVLLPDHSVLYPDTMQNSSPERYKIPMLWLGGAVSRAKRVDTLAAQSDLAATLLAQLGLPSSEFRFSRNFMKKSTPKFAFFTYNNGLGFVTNKSKYVLDLETNKELLFSGASALSDSYSGKAMLQMLLKDFKSR